MINVFVDITTYHVSAYYKPIPSKSFDTYEEAHKYALAIVGLGGRAEIEIRRNIVFDNGFRQVKRAK